jgi:hypothetical protein
VHIGKWSLLVPDVSQPGREEERLFKIGSGLDADPASIEKIFKPIVEALKTVELSIEYMTAPTTFAPLRPLTLVPVSTFSIRGQRHMHTRRV